LNLGKTWEECKNIAYAWHVRWSKEKKRAEELQAKVERYEAALAKCKQLRSSSMSVTMIVDKALNDKGGE